MMTNNNHNNNNNNNSSNSDVAVAVAVAAVAKNKNNNEMLDDSFWNTHYYSQKDNDDDNSNVSSNDKTTATTCNNNNNNENNVHQKNLPIVETVLSSQSSSSSDSTTSSVSSNYSTLIQKVSSRQTRQPSQQQEHEQQQQQQHSSESDTSDSIDSTIDIDSRMQQQQKQQQQDDENHSIWTKEIVPDDDVDKKIDSTTATTNDDEQFTALISNGIMNNSNSSKDGWVQQQPKQPKGMMIHHRKKKAQLLTKQNINDNNETTKNDSLDHTNKNILNDEEQQQQHQQYKQSYSLYNNSNSSNNNTNNNNASYHLDTDDELDDKAIHSHRSIQFTIDDEYDTKNNNNNMTTTSDFNNDNNIYLTTTTTTTTDIPHSADTTTDAGRYNDVVVTNDVPAHCSTTTSSSISETTPQQHYSEETVIASDILQQPQPMIAIKQKFMVDCLSSIDNNNNSNKENYPSDNSCSKVAATHVVNEQKLASLSLLSKSVLPVTKNNVFESVVNNCPIISINNPLTTNATTITTTTTENDHPSMDDSSTNSTTSLDFMKEGDDDDVVNRCATQPVNHDTVTTTTNTTNAEDVAYVSSTNTKNVTKNTSADEEHCEEPMLTNGAAKTITTTSDTTTINALTSTVSDSSNSSSSDDDYQTEQTKEEFERQIRLWLAWQKKREHVLNSSSKIKTDTDRNNSGSNNNDKLLLSQEDQTLFVPRVLRYCTSSSPNHIHDRTTMDHQCYISYTEYKKYIIDLEHQRTIWFQKDIEQMKYDILTNQCVHVRKHLQTFLLKIKYVVKYIQSMKDSVHTYNNSIDSIIHDWYVNPKDGQVYSTEEQAIKKVIYQRRYGSATLSSSSSSSSSCLSTNYLQPIIDSLILVQHSLNNYYEKIDVLVWYSQLLFEQTKNYINKIILPILPTIPDRIWDEYQQQYEQYEQQIQFSYQHLLQVLQARCDCEKENPSNGATTGTTSSNENIVPTCTTGCVDHSITSATQSDDNNYNSIHTTSGTTNGMKKGYDTDIWVAEIQYKNKCRMAKWGWYYQRQYTEQTLVYDPINKLIIQQTNQLHDIVLHYLIVQKDILQSCSKALYTPAISSLYCKFSDEQTNNTLMKSIVDDAVQTIMMSQQKEANHNNQSNIDNNCTRDMTNNAMLQRQQKMILFKQKSMSSYLYLDTNHSTITSLEPIAKTELKNNEQVDSNDMSLKPSQKQNQQANTETTCNKISSSTVPELVPFDFGSSGFVYKQYIFLVECPPQSNKGNRTNSNDIDDEDVDEEDCNQSDKDDDDDDIWKVALGVITGDDLLHIFPTSLEHDDVINKDSKCPTSPSILLADIQKIVINSGCIYPYISIKLSDWNYTSTTTTTTTTASTTTDALTLYKTSKDDLTKVCFRRKFGDNHPLGKGMSPVTTNTVPNQVRTNKKITSLQIPQHQHHPQSIFTKQRESTGATTKMNINKINVRFLFESDRIGFMDTYV